MGAPAALINRGVLMFGLTALPGSTQMLVVTSGGLLQSQATPSGSIAGSTGSVDNAAVRADGTGGSTIQGSAIVIEDDGTLKVRQNGGVAGTDELRLWYDGSKAIVASMDGNLQIRTGGAVSGLVQFADAAGNVRASVDMVSGTFNLLSSGHVGDGGTGRLLLVDGNGFLQIRGDYLAKWRAAAFGAFETGVRATAAGLVVIDDGAGSLRDLQGRNCNFNGDTITLSGLPTANPGANKVWNDAGTLKLGT